MQDPSLHKLFEWLLYLERPVGNIVQVGANTGQEIPAFERYGVDWAIMIEPLDEAFAKLSEQARPHPHFIPVQALCSSDEGTKHTFWIANNEGQSSSMMRPLRHQIEYPRVKFPSAIKLFSTTVDAVVARAVAAHPELAAVRFDTLMIDVQGGELKVLMGAPALLGQVRHVIAEVSDELYEGGPTLEDLQAHLAGFGFRLNNVRLNREGSGDALFIKPGA